MEFVIKRVNETSLLVKSIIIYSKSIIVVSYQDRSEILQLTKKNSLAFAEARSCFMLHSSEVLKGCDKWTFDKLKWSRLTIENVCVSICFFSLFNQWNEQTKRRFQRFQKDWGKCFPGKHLVMCKGITKRSFYN